MKNNLAPSGGAQESKKPFYRETDSEAVLQLRQELVELTEEEIHGKLLAFQQEGKIEMALECFDERERRQQPAGR